MSAHILKIFILARFVLNFENHPVIDDAGELITCVRRQLPFLQYSCFLAPFVVVRLIVSPAIDNELFGHKSF